MRRTISKSLLFGVTCLFAFAAPAVAEDKSGGRIKTVVIGLKGRRGIGPGLAEAMSDIVQGEYANDRNRMVFGRADIKRLMEFEAEKQLFGCDDDSCLAEIASAMDVDRMVTGSLDKIGSGYFVVISELDANGVEPIARIQGRVPLNEDKLFAAVADLSRRLMKKATRERPRVVTLPPREKTPPPRDLRPANDPDVATPEAPPPPKRRAGVPDMERGLYVTSTRPATVRIGERDYGFTPATIDDVEPGEYTLALIPNEGPPMLVDVVVFDEGVTEVQTDYERPLGVSAEAKLEYEEADTSNTLFALGKMGGGAVLAGVVAPCVGLSLGVATIGTTPDAVFNLATFGSWGVLGATGCGLATWGIADLFMGPEPPDENEVGNEVLVRPPSGEERRLAFPPPPLEGMAH